MSAIDFLKIILQSWTLTRTGFLWKWILGSFGTLLSILLIGKNFLAQSVLFSVVIGLVIIFVIFLSVFLKNFISLQFKYWHFKFIESQYGNAIIVIKECSSIVHNLKEKKSFSDKEFMSAAIVICDELKKFFDLKTKSTCSVSIKIPAASDQVTHANGHIITESTAVKNLCRDPESRTRDTDLYKETLHTIIGNTAYTHILDNIKNKRDQAYYINQNISKSTDYRNTSIACNRQGVLPYKSEIACPLIRFGGAQTNYDVLGFICIDSNKEQVFNDKYDPKIVENISDELYDLILRRMQFNNP